MNSARAWLIAAVSVWAVTSGCSLETSKAGAACERSTQCTAGLACVKGKCSKDLSSIAMMNTVPMLGGGSGGSGQAGTGGEGESAAGSDGGTSSDQGGAGGS